MSVRYLNHFEDTNGLITYTWPKNLYELEIAQPLRTPKANAIGIDYSVRLISTAVSLKGSASARMRFVLPDGFNGLDADSERDQMATILHQIGVGRLFTSDGRYALASLSDMPSMTLQASSPKIVPVTLSFDIWSDWFGESHTHTEPVSTSGQQFTLTNNGLLAATQMELFIKAKSATGFAHPKLTNLTNGFEFESSRDAAAVNDTVWLLTDQLGPMAGFGPLFIFDDFTHYVLPPITQKVLSFRLEPGDNTIEYTQPSGTPDCDVFFSFNDMWPA